MGAFMGWMSRRLQSQPKSQSTPASSQRIKREPIAALTPSIKLESDIISLTNSDGESSVIEIISTSSTIAPQRRRKISSTGKKRRRRLSPIDSEGSDSDILDAPSTTVPPRRHRKTALSQKKRKIQKNSSSEDENDFIKINNSR